MEEKEKLVAITDEYEVSFPSGNTSRVEIKHTKDGNEVYKESTVFANHHVKVIAVRENDDGVIKNQTILVKIYRNGKWSEPIQLSPKDVRGNNPNADLDPACRISPIVPRAKAYYSDMIQAQCEFAERITVHQKTGYAMIDGKRIFLNGDYSVTKDGLTDKHINELPGQMSGFRFLPNKDPERYKTLLYMFCDDFPAPSELMFAGTAFAFLTALNGLLREILLEPRFILYFIGKTGCGKTSMGNWFLNCFGVSSYNSPAPTNFSSTENANERLYGIADSVLMLLDDKFPGGTAQARGKQSDVEQRALRGAGDKAARARLNADSTLKTTYAMKCNLIVTAEEAYTQVGESAIARSISVDLKPGDIRLDGENSMVDMWHNAKHLNQCMSEYIQYIITNWDNVKVRARNLFDEINPKARIGGHNRLAETITYLQMGIIIMCDWLISADVIDTKKAELIQGKSWETFKAMSEKQNQKITDEKPERMFTSAVKAMLDRNSIKAERIGFNENLVMGSKVGYYDDYYYYLEPQTIYVKVKEYYALQDKIFPLGQAALFKHLADEKMIEVAVEKGGRIRTTKNKRINGNVSKYLWLRVTALQDKEEES